MHRFPLRPFLLAAIAVCLTLTTVCACHPPADPPADAADVPTDEEGEVDTLAFRATHYYSVGDGFTAKRSGNDIIVTGITPHRDSTFLIAFVEEVAADSLALRHFSEQRFLSYAVPANPISKFILLCSDLHALHILFLLIGVSLVGIIVRRHRQRLPLISENSLLTLSLLVLFAALFLSAALYVALRHCEPHVWDAYFFHPTLNPFHPALTPLATCFLLSFWLVLILITTVATVVISYLQPTYRT